MTDVSETIQTSTEDTTPRFTQGETVTVSRGKYRGQTGTVLSVDNDHKQYAVQLTEGLKVLAFSAVKPKTERTLTLAEYEAILEKADAGTETLDDLIRQHFNA